MTVDGVDVPVTDGTQIGGAKVKPGPGSRGHRCRV